MTHEERRAKIESYGRAHDLLTAALKEFPREMWQWKPAPDRWSVHEIIVHVADSEASSYLRCRFFIAEPGKAIMPYDQDVWTQKLNYHAQSTDDALELFRWLRKMSYDLIKELPESAWSARLQHPEHADYTFDRWLDIYERHTVGHINQMRKNLEAWRARGSAASA
jgi:hypothetical protein